MQTPPWIGACHRAGAIVEGWSRTDVPTGAPERTSKDRVTVRLSYDESLVLSDMLSRWDIHGDHVPSPPEHPAERKIICELAWSAAHFGAWNRLTGSLAHRWAVLLFPSRAHAPFGACPGGSGRTLNGTGSEPATALARWRSGGT